MSTVQAGGCGGVMVWRMFSGHAVDLNTINHGLNVKVYPSKVAINVHPFMAAGHHLLMATG